MCYLILVHGCAHIHAVKTKYIFWNCANPEKFHGKITTLYSLTLCRIICQMHFFAAANQILQVDLSKLVLQILKLCPPLWSRISNLYWKAGRINFVSISLSLFCPLSLFLSPFLSLFLTLCPSAALDLHRGEEKLCRSYLNKARSGSVAKNNNNNECVPLSWIHSNFNKHMTELSIPQDVLPLISPYTE